MIRTMAMAAAGLAIAAAAMPAMPAAAQDASADRRVERRDRVVPDRPRADRIVRCRDDDSGTLIGAIAGGLLGRSGPSRPAPVPGRAIGRTGDRDCRR